MANFGQEVVIRARVAELVDALVLGTSGVTRESSSLSFRTKLLVSSKDSRGNIRQRGERATGRQIKWE